MNFQILGPLRVLDGNERELSLGGAKPSAVLALLILNVGEVVSADRLIEELWEGQPPASAAKSLQVHISRLRRALGANGSDGPVVTRAGGYVLDVDADQIDAVRAERSIADGSASLAEGDFARASVRLRSALSAWRGQPLADFAYASFTQDAIARLDSLRTVALEGAIEAELALGRHAELIPELTSLVRKHPLSEHLRGQLMLALYRSGRQAEALGVYRAGRRVLVDQLGIEPGTELRELERAILAQDPQLAAPDQPRTASRERASTAPGGLLVGYEAELTGLEDVLERTLVGHGRVTLVSGEPGVGKTRLTDEFARVAAARGARVVSVRCWDDGGAPPFWPWMQALRELGGDGLEVHTPALPDVPDARFRLFEATATFLRRAARDQPVVLIFDDLHAADASTLSLLAFVGSVASSSALMLLGTYRDTGAAADNPVLSGALVDLTRTSDCVQLVLTGLRPADTAHFVELSSGVAPMRELAAAIHDVTAGNPLFVSELVRLLQADGRLDELAAGDELRLPRGIDQVIARRLQQLSADCQRTLHVAAVIGSEVSLGLLAQVTEIDPVQLLDQVEEARAARLVQDQPDAGDTIRFAHDLVRQTLYAELGERERRQLHADIAAALERLNPGVPPAVLPRLAHHYSAAVPLVDAERAAHYLSLAGDAASEVMASDDAMPLYVRAAELATDPASLAELQVKIAEQLVIAGDASGAAAALARAEALSGGDLPPALEGRALVARAQYDLFDACAIPRARIEEVIALFQKLGDVTGEARAWDALGTRAHGHAEMEDAGAAWTQMLERARKAGSASLTDRALCGIGASLSRGPVPVAEARPKLRALLAQAASAQAKGRLHLYMAEVEIHAGRLDEARALIAEGGAIAGLDDTDWASRARTPATSIELLAGNMQRAEALLRTDCDEFERLGQSSYLASKLPYLAEALIGQGRLDEAEAELVRGEAVVVPTDIDAQYGQARTRALLHLARGELELAEAAIDNAIELAGQMQFPDYRIGAPLLKADIVARMGREDDARELATTVLAEAEALGHVVPAERARAHLAPQPAVSGA
jgi:DNA-binding SARP family transcriptional activator/tetratricopeptide (TPR) repeat protein